LVSEGGAGRASGGGQPELNADTQSPQLARSTPGGAPNISITAATVAEAAAAPEATGGGQPLAAMIDPASTSAVRTEAGGGEPISGGPSQTDTTGPPSEVSTADLLARAEMKRAEAGGEAAAPSGGGSEGEEDDEDEEERARQLARQALGGAPQLALAAPTIADAPTTPSADAGEAGGPAGSMAASAAASQLARADNTGGSPVAAESGPTMELAEGGAASGADAIPADTPQRAEAAEAMVGAATPGGGSASPARTASGPRFVANAQAITVQIAGAPESSGAPDGAPLQAQGIEATRLAGGANSAATNGPVGAAAGEMVVESMAAAQPGGMVGSRSSAPATSADGPAVGEAVALALPARRGTSNIAPVGAEVEIAMHLPAAPGAGGEARPDMGDLVGGANVGPMSRQATGGLAVNVAAPDGPGGLGNDYSVDVGINSRRASTESIQVSLRSGRFIQKQTGGLPDFNTTAVVAAEPFRRRSARDPGDGSGGGRGRPDPATEEAIELGLVFLARYQTPDGSWSLQSFNEDVALTSDAAATALALLAFQGAGYNHREFKYADVVRRGVDYLVKNQAENGSLFVPLDDDSNNSVWLYSHAIAALALSEAYGMTQDPELREPAQRALDFIIRSQHESRGGWRYSPNYGSDTSVTGWMMMALKSGELAGLDVPDETYQRIDHWLDLAQASKNEPHLFRYNPYAPDTPTQRHGRYASNTMTSVGLLMRLYLGWRRDEGRMQQGADYLLQNLPTLGTSRDPQRDTYYWYYGTQVMFHMGGKYWESWNQALHPLLSETQIQQGAMAGSWEPRGPIPDRWAPHAGRLYVTTMNLLSLEVYYRHLPLYDDTAK
ncbi:MAG: hypothetical protein KDA38_12640, partial [Planctomycetales bacterium]|nr:hypothetical protein [Planctomycetales bacterium]